MTPNRLDDLARLYGVQTAYRDAMGFRRHAKPEAVLAVLRAMGAPIERIADVPSAVRERQWALWGRVVEPVAIAWDGGGAGVEVRRPERNASGTLACELTLQGGEVRQWTVEASELQRVEGAEIEGERFVAQRLVVRGPLPFGYHALVLETGGERYETLVVSAPVRAYPAGVPGGLPGNRPRVETHLALARGTRTQVDSRGARGRGTRTRGPHLASAPGTRGESADTRGHGGPAADSPAWGVFLPLYALHSARSWGCGDFTDLAAFAEWVGELGGGVVATLPLLAAFLDGSPEEGPFEPSPYSPVSRRFWNELYLDVERVPELVRCGEARALVGSTALQGRVDALRRAPLVDYGETMAVKRGVLEALAGCFFAGDGPRTAAFRHFLESSPRVEDYASFRAASERLRSPWSVWPARQRGGRLVSEDYDRAAYRYHVYVQWLAHQQLGEVADGARARGVRLYLDLPLGVHPEGYDAWRDRELFAAGVSGGAPPDPFFTGGQDWGFRPLHPGREREGKYGYTIATLRHHLRYAGVLRIDHVMSLHRLFWVPHGLGARDGVYVRYNAPELYAILTLESHRHRALIVGEDLGTVPREVRRAMARHGVHRMHVVQFELEPDREAVLPPAPRTSVASINTHDMAPFAAFWEGADLDTMRELGLLDAEHAQCKQARRRRIRQALSRFLASTGSLDEAAATPAAVLRACLARLGAGRARVVLVSLEDLWLETRPQNVPGTWREQPNWRRKARYGLEEFRERAEVVEPLVELARLRKRERSE